MKTIWCKISDGDNITACSTKIKALQYIKDGEPDMTKKEALEILDEWWQEITLN